MMVNEKRVGQQFRNFEKALEGYQYNEPLSRYLTRFFKENKQMGSSDRRMTSRFCYNYFRLGNSLKGEGLLERLVIAEFLCESASDLVLLHKPEWAGFLSASVSVKFDRLKALNIDFEVNDVFPFLERLSQAVDVEAFIQSQFIQPNLFIRIKRGQETAVKESLLQYNFTFDEINERTLSLNNGSKLQSIKGLSGKYEVQDLSSQATVQFMDAAANENWWDACAASGGKALMFLDAYPKVNLLVSDIRLSILRNLDERFEQAKMRQSYRKKVIDLSQSAKPILGDEKFDGIILDVPCSGSGTWGRTPEMIQQFSEEKLQSFATLQKKIVSNVIPHLKMGKPLIYMTCSVYKDENEDVVEYIVREYGYEVELMELLKGYANKADSMFAARLVRHK